MEDIAPVLRFVIEMESSLERGESVRTGIRFYLKHHRTNFSAPLFRILNSPQPALSPEERARLKSSYQIAALELIVYALEGKPVLSELRELKNEIVAASNRRIDQFVSVLPTKMMIPLLFLIFPALLLLLFGPLVQSLQEALN